MVLFASITRVLRWPVGLAQSTAPLPPTARARALVAILAVILAILVGLVLIVALRRAFVTRAGPPRPRRRAGAPRTLSPWEQAGQRAQPIASTTIIDSSSPRSSTDKRGNDPPAQGRPPPSTDPDRTPDPPSPDDAGPGFDPGGPSDSGGDGGSDGGGGGGGSE